MNKVYLGLGSNIGDRKIHLEMARNAIEQQLGKITQQSSIIETMPWGVENQAKYLNQVLCIETSLAPLPLLHSIHKIESDMGRVRLQKWEARIIDIDILFFNDEIIQHESLTIPHALAHLRHFVLQPLIEIAPQLIHPFLHKSISELSEDLSTHGTGDIA